MQSFMKLLVTFDDHSGSDFVIEEVKENIFLNYQNQENVSFDY